METEESICGQKLERESQNVIEIDQINSKYRTEIEDKDNLL